MLATCFASHIAPVFLVAAAAITGVLGVFGNRQCTDARVYGIGGAALWWCLLRSGVNADVAGVLVAFCISTKAMIGGGHNTAPAAVAGVGAEDGEDNFEEDGENFSERLVTRLAPLATFFIMPAFALANTAVNFGGGLAAGAGAAARHSAVAPALGIGAGLLIGKPLGIFGSTWLATKLGIAEMPAGMTKRHLAVVSMLGAIGFTMCLLLTEVAMPSKFQAIPKLSVLISSGVASIVGAVGMSKMTPINPADKGAFPVEA